MAFQAGPHWTQQSSLAETAGREERVGSQMLERTPGLGPGGEGRSGELESRC